MPGGNPVSIMNMRALFDMKGPREDVARAIGASELPHQPNTRTENDGHEIYWVGPEYWILSAPLDKEQHWADRFGELADNPDLLVIVVSDLYCFLEICGDGAEEIVASLTSLDFGRLEADAALFTEVLGQKALLIKRQDSWEIAIENSLKDFLVKRLEMLTG